MRTRGDDSSAGCVHLVRMYSWCCGVSFVGVCGGGRDGCCLRLWLCRGGSRICMGRARLLDYALLRKAGDGGLIVVVVVCRVVVQRCHSKFNVIGVRSRRSFNVLLLFVAIVGCASTFPIAGKC